MTAAALRDDIGGEWTERADGWWLDVEPGRIRDVAAACVAAGGRFSALVGRAGQGPADAVLLSWHWDVRGTLLSVRASFQPGVEVPSIVDLCPGADWAEREARDYFALAFSGRAATPPLMLREGDRPGILLPEGGPR